MFGRKNHAKQRAEIAELRAQFEIKGNQAVSDAGDRLAIIKAVNWMFREMQKNSDHVIADIAKVAK